MPEIELLSLSATGDAHVGWTCGPRRTVAPDPRAVAAALVGPGSDAVLCLDGGLPLPDEALLRRLLDGPCDAWHAGLRLGLSGHPRALVHVYPQWMLTTPVDPDIETTSPLLTLRAMLVRRSTIEQLGGPDPEMETLSGAGLDLGVRWIRAGALVRHVPALVPPGTRREAPPSTADGFRTVARHHGRTWAGWAALRSVTQREVTVGQLPRIASAVRRATPAARVNYESPQPLDGDTDRTVSVILPTVDRYPFLEPLLHQLAGQTKPPHEVIVVDQTARDRRRHGLAAAVPGLPVKVVEQDVPGQSTARNAALRIASGELVLFIDDDDEIGDDLLARHLERLVDGIDAICGGVDDATAGPPPPGFRHRRASPVFPTNNAMVRLSALRRSGLFDPAYDRGPRADRDLGIRLHLSGATLVYDPSVMVFHHHAPAGGLRTHGARAVTRASARRSLTERNLPAVTEEYLAMRYYTAHQRREARAVRVLSILSGGGPPGRRLLRGAVQLALLPDTLARMRRTRRAAAEVLAGALPVPVLAPPSDDQGTR